LTDLKRKMHTETWGWGKVKKRKYAAESNLWCSPPPLCKTQPWELAAELTCAPATPDSKSEEKGGAGAAPGNGDGAISTVRETGGDHW
jgi:hypothetical protein